MRRRQFLAGCFVVATATAGACGNYSNDDLDYQLALPAKTDLTIAMQAATAPMEDQAEYYRATRDVVSFFNAVVDALLRPVDLVRAFTPSQRRDDSRVWGPWRDDRHPGWLARLIITRHDDPTVANYGFRFEYQFQLRRALPADSPWIVFMNGLFLPRAGVRRGDGALLVDTAAARAAGYSVDDPRDPNDWNQLKRLELTYARSAFPVRVNMKIENFPGAESPGAEYSYEETKTGAGRMTFHLDLRTNPARGLRIDSRWTGAGAGRSDVTAATLPGLAAADCWDVTGKEVYRFRQWEMTSTIGRETDCPTF